MLIYSKQINILQEVNVMEIPTGAIIAAICILVVIAVILITWKKAPADKAIVVTGLKKRVISGGEVLLYLSLNKLTEYL